MNELRALIRKSLGKKADRGSQVSPATFIASLLFGMLIFVLFLDIGFFAIIGNWFNRNNYRVVVVNAPVSWKEYSEELTKPVNNSHETRKGYEFYYYEHPYAYDVSQFNKWMKDDNSSLCVVFDGNDILTFYPPDNLSYASRKDDFKAYLEQYISYLSTGKCNIYTYTNPVTIFTTDTSINSDDYEYYAICFMLIPIVYFIAILFSAMSHGTYLVSGSKEQGTFSSLLMTPVSRLKIILGYTIGTWIKTLIPIGVISILVALFAFFRFQAGAVLVMITAIFQMMVIAFFVSALITLISVMNNSVVSAQTTFLPIFFLFIVLCITIMQNPADYDGFYHYIPFYGQYLGLGYVLMNSFSILELVSSTVSTMLLSYVTIKISEKLLYTERFTVESNSASNKELLRAQKEISRQKNDYVAKPKLSIYGYVPTKRLDHGSFISSQVTRPLVILSVFQLLSLIPPILLTSGSGLTEIMYALKEVNTVPGVIKVSANIMSVIMSSPLFMASMGLGYIFMILYYCFRVKMIEKDSLTTMGFGYKKAVLRYVAGIVLGLVMISLVYVLLLATGQIKIDGFGISSDKIILFLAYISMWIPQGATEEIMFRGYMMPRVASRYGLVPAIAVSSVLFCLFHGMNPGFNILALINLILISVLYALIAYYMDNIWTLCACHSIWNFTQGNIFGLEVSGNAGNATLIHTVFKSSASDLWTGGGFGPEGGLAVTIVAIIFIVLVIVFKDKLKQTRKL